MKKLKRIFIAVLAICLSFGSLFGATAIYKNTTFSSLAYSQNADKSILSDLKKLEDFDENNYTEEIPVKLIHIKENKQTLYIYAYMNSEKLKYNLSSINISTDPDKLNFNNYKLEVVGKYNNYIKCKVKGLAIKTDTVREYNISSIFTDETSKNGSQTTNETAYEVGMRFVFSTNEKNEPILNKFETETITITDKFVGFVRYENGFLSMTSSCDSHFIAFSTDRDIDKLLEADVSFVSQDYQDSSITGYKEYSKINNKVQLNYTQSVEIKQGFIIKKKYSWNRIETANEFLNSLNKKDTFFIKENKTVNMSSEDEEKIKNQQFILRFYESSYTVLMENIKPSNPLITGAPIWVKTTSGTLVSEVTILRLKFEKDGVTYNLGAVDNKTTGSKDPAIIVAPQFDWQKIVKIILIVCLVLATIPLVPIILNLLVYLIKALVAIIKFPFKLAKQKK